LRDRGRSVVGYAGELHPKTLTALGLPPRTVALELDVDVLARASEPTTRYHEISTFPAALTDVALVVSDRVTAAEVEGSLRSGAGDYLEEVALFDVYAGEQVGDGNTSLAYRLTFRAPDRTLTTEEVNGFRDAAVAAAGSAVGAVQRT
jgi:phenylalanyl-tRNA synthetase beta chain